MNLRTVMLVLVLPVGAKAQQVVPGSSIAVDEAVAALTLRATSSIKAPPPPPPTSRKRRGSMVGYIQDAGVNTQLRVRGDAGFHDERPDRAEFFYAKCGCFKQLATLAPPAYDPNVAGPGPGIANDINFQQLSVQAQLGFMDRAAVFVEVPVRFLQPKSFEAGGPPGTFGNQSGLSDIRAGAKVALVNTAMTTLTAQVQGYFKTGDAAKGLGTDHNSVEPALLLSTTPTDRFGLESQVGYWHAIDGSAGVPTASDERFSGDMFFYGIGPSYELVRTETYALTPVLELVGWHITKGLFTGPASCDFRTCDSSGANIVNIKAGARASFGVGNSIYFGYGRGLTDAKWYRDIFRLEYRRDF